MRDLSSPLEKAATARRFMSLPFSFIGINQPERETVEHHQPSVLFEVGFRFRLLCSACRSITGFKPSARTTRVTVFIHRNNLRRSQSQIQRSAPRQRLPVSILVSLIKEHLPCYRVISTLWKITWKDRQCCTPQLLSLRVYIPFCPYTHVFQ